MLKVLQCAQDWGTNITPYIITTLQNCSENVSACLPLNTLLMQVTLPVRRRRRRRKQASPRWMRLCRCTGGTVTRRCTPAATSTRAVESTCSSLTTPIHFGAPRVFTTECTTPDKPGYRHRGSQGVHMFVCVCVCVDVEICAVAACMHVGGVFREVLASVLPALFWTKPPEGDKETSGTYVWRLD